MQIIYEIFPVFLFFIAFKFYDIYIATVVGIAATFVQVLFNRIWLKQWDKKQLVTLGVFIVFGGMTLYFHNPIFVKWKPTIVFWVFALILIGSQWFTKKPLLQRLMENMLQHKHEVPKHAWQKLNLAWTLFFSVMGGINLYVAYAFSNNAWVNFKFYGITSAVLLLSVGQALYLMRYVSEFEQHK